MPGLIARLGDVFPELAEQQTRISTVLKTEEESFNRTLDRGIALFEREVAILPEGEKTISGATAFRLYDEQGFPFDLTQVMARERGLGVDETGFEAAMQEQKERSRGAQVKEIITAKTAPAEPAADPYADAVQTEFVGYVRDSSVANVEGNRRGRRPRVRRG